MNDYSDDIAKIKISFEFLQHIRDVEIMRLADFCKAYQLMLSAKTYQDIIAVKNHYPKDIQKSIWELLQPADKERIINFREEYERVEI